MTLDSSKIPHPISQMEERIEGLEIENAKLLEVIDNQAAEIRDLRERLAGGEQRECECKF